MPVRMRLDDINAVGFPSDPFRRHQRAALGGLEQLRIGRGVPSGKDRRAARLQASSVQLLPSLVTAVSVRKRNPAPTSSEAEEKAQAGVEIGALGRPSSLASLRRTRELRGRQRTAEQEKAILGQHLAGAGLIGSLRIGGGAEQTCGRDASRSPPGWRYCWPSACSSRTRQGDRKDGAGRGQQPADAAVGFEAALDFDFLCRKYRRSGCDIRFPTGGACRVMRDGVASAAAAAAVPATRPRNANARMVLLRIIMLFAKPKRRETGSPQRGLTRWAQ